MARQPDPLLAEMARDAVGSNKERERDVGWEIRITRVAMAFRSLESPQRCNLARESINVDEPTIAACVLEACRCAMSSS